MDVCHTFLDVYSWMTCLYSLLILPLFLFVGLGSGLEALLGLDVQMMTNDQGYHHGLINRVRAHWLHC